MMRICGKKCAVCCSLLSAWGIIMLVLMGIFLYTKSVAFAEDIEVKMEGSRTDFLNEVNRRYTAAATNCWIAACLYVVTLIVSFQQYCANQKARNTA